MNNILKDIDYSKLYTNSINNSKYTQKIKTLDVEYYKYLEDLIIFTNDIESILDRNNKMYIKNKKIEYASKLSEKSDIYKSFNY